MPVRALLVRSHTVSTALRYSRPATFSPLIRYFSDVDGPKQRLVKVKKKEKKGKGSDGGRSRDVEILIACLDAPKSKPPPADDEELQRREQILKNYTVGKFRQHNQENHDLTCKLKLKQHAMKMLPKNSKLREKALEVDDTMPPRWRKMPTWTPPIPGFDPSEFMIQEE
ncbi:mitochondrial ribosomal protein L28 [Nitzschia inconspicua]|uniref:Large ribosomal subunit protein mL40 n=1 Tax=Nitzschia inconspicua TaxID=303405 RepID=A0A9K3LQ96_9STRA|nr:mitochondrial ribosomal protein L28 [Nitzschia inconspicua]